MSDDIAWPTVCQLERNENPALLMGVNETTGPSMISYHIEKKPAWNTLGPLRVAFQTAI